VSPADAPRDGERAAEAEVHVEIDAKVVIGNAGVQ